MFDIDNRGNIKITKGDNAEIDIRLYDKDKREVKILPSDVIRFTATTSPQPINKIAQINSIFISPSDTADKQTGTYIYQVELERDGEYQTISGGFFEICEDLIIHG